MKGMIHNSYHNVKIHRIPMAPRKSTIIKSSISNPGHPTVIEGDSSLDEERSQFHTLYEQFPIFSTSKVHSDYGKTYPLHTLCFVKYLRNESIII